ncbi:unnamed protein product (macronuclear) [Paramecium tetraurelia]|uniref:Cyclic nucleotide-binding domain-containing protein n=1 Tax=Paramecium tetraurelia TaxID=5888 RepID=A0DVS8_PARTE|nr:uncharacterized protein GSPATT00020798001 [Paramecium tetraurelia]CAK87145.1 unnamed protein product [Paramecium tetraurelia]|eukprot:XP_001454542.1 hypothetical protein (macronuclear) [Paramecium tetraurelia strain d4-2]
MNKFIRKNSLNTQALKEQENKKLKQYILQMEQDQSLYETLTQEQIFGILCIILTKSSYHRTQSEIEILKKATIHIDYFQKLVEKDQGPLLWERCLRKMSYTYLSYGQTLFREGDVGTTFYIILQGRVSIHKRLLVQEEFQDKELIQLQDGQGFGELALENNEPRSASVKAILPTHLAVLEAEDYMVIKKTVINQQRQMYFEEFAKLSIFRDWKFTSIKSLFDVIKQNKYRLNHTIFKEGDPSNEVYFIQTGQFKAVKTLRITQEIEENSSQDDLQKLKDRFAYSKPSLSNSDKIDMLYQKKKYGNLVIGDKKSSMTLKFVGAGEMFGELEILKQQDLCRQFSFISTFESNTVYSVSKRDFLRVLQNDPPLLQSLNSLNDDKLKQALAQIKAYEKNFIDQTEKQSILQKTQIKEQLNPKLLTDEDLESKVLVRNKTFVSKVGSKKQCVDKKIRELTLTLQPPKYEMNYSTLLTQLYESQKHRRQRTEQQINLVSKKGSKTIKNSFEQRPKTEMMSHDSPKLNVHISNVLSKLFASQPIIKSNFNEEEENQNKEQQQFNIKDIKKSMDQFQDSSQNWLKKYPTESTLTRRIHSTTSRQLQTSPKSSKFGQIDRFNSNSFKSHLPLVLQNKYFRLTPKQQ